MKTRTQEKRRPLKGERGQGLVEMMLILPFLLVLVVGLVEAGIALNRQLTVINAAREGARFGAFGAAPGDIHTQTLLATSGMFEFTEGNAVVAVIHATTNQGGDGFKEWVENTYPDDATIPHVTQEEVLAQLNAEGDPADVRLVVVDVRYDHQSLLGLPFVGALSDQIPIGSWTAMRLPVPGVGQRQTVCCTLPIAVHESTLQGKEEGDHLEDIFNGADSGNFGWLRWPANTNYASATWLARFLSSCGWSTGNPDPDNFPDYPGFQNAKDSTDHDLSPGDWVWGNSGLSDSSANRAALDALVGSYMRVIVWDVAEGTGSGAMYHVKRFAIIQIICGENAPDTSACWKTSPSVCGGDPYCLPGTNRISARFIRWGDECG